MVGRAESASVGDPPSAAGREVDAGAGFRGAGGVDAGLKRAVRFDAGRHGMQRVPLGEGGEYELETWPLYGVGCDWSRHGKAS